MSSLKRTISSVSLSILVSVLAFPSIANATDLSEQQAKMEALSYAPEGSFNDERFGQFNFETEAYEEHELNDAWLGMPVHSSNGKLIGFINDAIIDENGFVNQVIIGLNEQQTIVEINAKYAELTNEKVQLELSTQQVAALLPSNKLASLQ